MVTISSHARRGRPRSGLPTRRTERYEHRRPDKTPLHRIVSTHLETWLASRDRADQPVPGHVEEEFRAYLRCGILCFGFARGRCTACDHGFLIGFSCKGRGVCPSCNGRRMAETAAHLVDRVFPPVPVRQWVISVPKRLRWFLADRPEAVTALTTIFLGEIERLLRDAAGMSHAENAPPSARPRFGAVSFLHRFGSALNRHVHLHTCVTDGVFTRSPEGVAFAPARPISPADLQALTQRVRHRVIGWFRRRGLIDAKAAADMLAWENSGFSIDASVRISLTDRDVPGYFQSLEHLVRYCARPAFALERLCRIEARDGRPERIRYTLSRHKRGAWIGPGRARKSSAPDARGVIHLSPHELLDRLADLIPPPRKHRHRYHGVFAPNHALRAAVTALAIGNAASPQRPPGAGRGDGAGDGTPRSHDTSRIAWAKLLARIGERLPLACPNCGGDIRLIAFITDPGPIRRILTHVGEPLEPPPLAPARGPPTAWPELVQAHDDGDVVQGLIDELPVIDIHAR